MVLHCVLKGVLTFKRKLYAYSCMLAYILYTHTHLTRSTVSVQVTAKNQAT